MKNTLLLLIVCLTGFASCNKEAEPVLTKQQIKYKVDSITSIRMKEQDEMYHRDLQHRIKIEVKIKVDSIVNSQLNKKRNNDTAINSAQPAKIVESQLPVSATPK